MLSTVTRSRDETRAVETLLDSRCAALLLLGPEAPAEKLADLGRQLPVVVIGRPAAPIGFDSRGPRTTRASRRPLTTSRASATRT